MIYQAESLLIVAITFIWIGFILSISFMEAWLKFKAPGVTLTIGLSIGKLIFNTLNKIEWSFLIIILSTCFFTSSNLLKDQKSLLILPSFILIIQTIWFLPKLNARAKRLINGEKIKISPIHFYYVVSELIKVISLTLFGSKLFI